MATDRQTLLGAGEEDDEDDMELEMDVKEEDDDDDENSEKQSSMMAGFDGAMPTSSGNSNPRFTEAGTPTGGGGRRCRPVEEKERTKLRERHRRAITARILAGLRRHGNYNLRVRADINDVISALAREAGWCVLPDGTTFPSKSPTPKQPTVGLAGAASSSSPRMVLQQNSSPLEGVGIGFQGSVDFNACSRMKGVYMPSSSPYDISASARSQTFTMVGDETDCQPFVGGSIDAIDDNQVVEIPSKLPDRDFSSTPYVPVYVMLPLGVVNMKCELVDPDGLVKQLRALKSVNVDGVAVDCWWGIVEAHSPQEYNWSGYKRLFHMARELKLKLQVMIAFHECGGNVGDDVCIPLPNWVAEIGRNNPDIFFTDREGRRNPECLSWGIDKERVLRGRTAVEVYFDFMRSFRVEFNEFFEAGIISMIQVGLGPCGELRYPSCPVKHGWRFPGIGEFQCYDQYLLRNLRKAAELRGHSFWARGPDNAGSYNSKPHETGFFCDGGDYDGYYGRFFLKWYSQALIDHGDRVLSLAKLAFEGTCIAAKLSGIHWWYKSASHAAELTAGFYNPCNRDGYAAIMSMLNKHKATLRFTSLDLHDGSQDALADPEGLVWQMLNAAWDVCVPVANENVLPCENQGDYDKILEATKPTTDPDARHLSSFTYLRLNPHLMERTNFSQFQQFVKRMHGEALRV